MYQTCSTRAESSNHQNYKPVNKTIYIPLKLQNKQASTNTEEGYKSNDVQLMEAGESAGVGRETSGASTLPPGGAVPGRQKPAAPKPPQP